jgi:hypothetical protein
VGLVAYLAMTNSAAAYTWCGDIDCDGQVTSVDVLAVLRAAIGLAAHAHCPLECSSYHPKPEELPADTVSVQQCADFDSNGVANVRDARALLLHALDPERPIACSSAVAMAHARFRDVTSRSGIHHEGDSWGGAWGDYDRDGWPDLWVTNHFEKSTLYRNISGQRFEEVSGTVVVPSPVRADAHATAWVDFDNDGDLDLFEQIGGGGGTASAIHPMPKHLYVNENGQLYERAVDFGVDYPTSRGRGALFLDFDLDGLLDLLLLTELRPDRLYPSAILQQEANHTFVHVTEDLSFDVPLSSKYAHVCDLTGEGQQEIVIHGGDFPQRIYQAGHRPFVDMRQSLRFPVTRYVEDSAAGDFDGDLDIDFFLVRNLAGSQVDWLGGRVVRAFLFPYLTTDEHGFVIRTFGNVSVHLEASQPIDPSLVYIGRDGHHPSAQQFVGQRLTLRTDDLSNEGVFPHESGTMHGVFIGWRPVRGEWSITVGVPPNEPKQRLFNIEVTSDATISGVEGLNIVDAVPHANRLLLNSGSRFVDATVSAGLNFPTECHSVASGDFDNDMDLDLHLVCTRRTRNLPDLFLENRGDGTFSIAPDAAGAQASSRGLGDVALTADFNRDGFLDLFLTNGHPLKPFNVDGPDQLFLNQRNGNHWLELDLVGVRSNRDAVGATVTVTAGGIPQMRQVGCTSHKWAFDERLLHFGLGPYTRVEEIRIAWPNGALQVFTDMPADQLLRVSEPGE